MDQLAFLFPHEWHSGRTSTSTWRRQACACSASRPCPFDGTFPYPDSARLQQAAPWNWAIWFQRQGPWQLVAKSHSRKEVAVQVRQVVVEVAGAVVTTVVVAVVVAVVAVVGTSAVALCCGWLPTQRCDGDPVPPVAEFPCGPSGSPFEPASALRLQRDFGAVGFWSASRNDFCRLGFVLPHRRTWQQHLKHEFLPLFALLPILGTSPDWLLSSVCMTGEAFPDKQIKLEHETECELVVPCWAYL